MVSTTTTSKARIASEVLRIMLLEYSFREFAGLNRSYPCLYAVAGMGPDKLKYSCQSPICGVAML